ncbi:hypothetical protein Aduo_004956 [Ancylostoma duodenale]
MFTIGTSYILGYVKGDFVIFSARAKLVPNSGCGSMPAVTIFVAYAPTSGYNEEEVEAFSMDSEKFYREDYTFYKKPTSPQWTWESLGGEHHNETDHIIVNRRYCLTDVGVVPKFYTGSDHRLLRAKFFFSRRGEKAAKFKKWNPKPVIDWDLFISLAGIREDADSIDEECDGLVQRLRDSAKKAEGQEPPRGACLSRPSSLYASVELREPQATTS